MEQANHDIELDALDIICGDASEEQLARLRDDDRLADCVQAALDMRAEVQRMHGGSDAPDVEDCLRQFHRQAGHNLPSPSARMRKAVVWTTLLAAAVVSGIVFMLLRPSTPPAPDDYFSPTQVQRGIRLTAQNGSEATLSPQTRQNTSLTLDDFRRLFDDTGRIRNLTLTVPFGKSADITLPDSSKVYLSPGTQLTFPSAFTGDKRVVKLEGIAYFKVAPQASQPFIVLTNTLQTQVLGTEFSIDSRQGAVTLITGKVSVSPTAGSHTPADSRTLHPNEHGVLTDHGTLAVSTVDPTPYTMWRDGYLYFDHAELKDIMQAIGANFNKTVDFKSQKALHYKMRFITERNRGVTAAIDMMNRMQKVKVSLNGNTIVVEDL